VGIGSTPARSAPLDTVSPTHWRISIQEQPSEVLAELVDR
jgi:hypothetical protein